MTWISADASRVLKSRLSRRTVQKIRTVLIIYASGIYLLSIVIISENRVFLLGADRIEDVAVKIGVGRICRGRVTVVHWIIKFYINRRLLKSKTTNVQNRKNRLFGISGFISHHCRNRPMGRLSSSLFCRIIRSSAFRPRLDPLLPAFPWVTRQGSFLRPHWRFFLGF